MSTNLRLNAGTLASDCYPPSPQQLYNEMFERGSALIGDITGVIISDTAPDANDRDKGWVKTNGGAPTSPSVVYIWFNGSWVAANPTEASGLERRIFVGSTTDLETYDGGEAGAVGVASGPMWEVDTTFAGRFPIGAGAVAGSDPALTVAVGDTGGAPQVEMAANQLPPHQHIVPVCAINSQTTDPPADGSPATVQYGIGKDQGVGDVVDESGSQYARSFPLTSAYPDVAVTPQEDVSTLPNYKGVLIIKRSARVYYRGG